MIRIISFDLDGTLVDGRYGNMVWLEGVPACYAERYGMTFDDALKEVRRAYDSVGESHLLWYDIGYWLARFDLTLSIPDLLERYSSHIRLLPHVSEVVAELASRYRLAIASNAARLFVEKELGQTGIGRYFDTVVSATSDFCMVKKEEAFYRRLCETLGVTAGEVAHVGDHRIFDFEVPRLAGIDSYHYDPSGGGSDGVIGDFRELLERL